MLSINLSKGVCAYSNDAPVYIPFSLRWQLLIQVTGRLLGAWQRLTTHISWETLIAEPKFTGSWRATKNLSLAILELINVPSGEDNLVFQKFRFGRDNPNKEIGGKRDCLNRKRTIVSYFGTNM